MENINRLTVTAVYPDGDSRNEDMAVISEHVLEILINEQPVYRLVCTKNDLRELVTGRLMTDGLIDDADDIDRMYFCKYENEASVFLRNETALKEVIRTDRTCCTGNRVYAAGQPNLAKLHACDYRPEWIFALADEFRNGSKIHDTTGATHMCILAKGGRTLYVSEDIGRHNAVDKAVGYALLNDIALSECILFTSGRVPVDMTEKIIAAGIPVLVSKSVPTAESVELATTYGLNLICRAWPDRYEIFAPVHL